MSHLRELVTTVTSGSAIELTVSRPERRSGVALVAGVGGEGGSPRRSSRRWAGWAALAATAALPGAEAIRLMVDRSTVALYGDQALLALGAHRAAHFDQLVGPYSRAGFHHPGPALFYLLAPFIQISRTTAEGMYLGAIVINAAAMLAAVAVMWRQTGPLAALWTAGVVNVFSICLGVGTLRQPWNPYLVIAPMLLFVLLCAFARSKSGVSMVWVFVVGSYEVQTHIATTAVVLVLVAASTVNVILQRRDPPRPMRRVVTPAGWLGLVTLSVMWALPVIDVFADHPSNPTSMWDFFTGRHPPVDWGQLLSVAGDALSVLPFGNRDYVLSLHRSVGDLVVVGLIIAAVTALTVKTAQRRGTVSPYSLLKLAAVVAVVGVASLAGSDGPVYLYFALWLSVVPLVLLVGLGAALLGDEKAPPGESTRPIDTAGWVRSTPALVLVTSACAGALISASALAPLGHTVGSGPWPPADASPPQRRAQTVTDTAMFDRAVLSVLRRGDRTAALVIGSPSLWPYAAGLVLRLAERGVATSVTPQSWVAYFGNEDGGHRRADVSFGLYPIAVGSGADRSGGNVLEEVDGAFLSYRRAVT